MTRLAFSGADIFDGHAHHDGKVLLVEDGRSLGLVARAPDDAVPVDLPGGTLMPGFVDLQVNGGGGVMFNDETTVGGVAAIAAAHATTGTRALLPTLITDTPDRSRAAVAAVEAAIAQGIPGVVGLHLEGPHLSVARKGAHDPALIRPMEDEDEAFLTEAASRLPNLLVTLAPESVTPDRVARLAAAGVVVSLGHTDCAVEDAQAAFVAGARVVTHLFNAMSQMAGRAPGLVGAALATPGVAAGLIADGIHVHPEAMRVALAAAPGRVFLVTDAMSTVGSDITEFRLNGRRVLRRDGRLTLEDGTLAGADLDMPTALRVLTGKVGVGKAEALAMSTSGPASVLRNAQALGTLGIGQPVIWLDAEGRYRDLPGV